MAGKYSDSKNPFFAPEEDDIDDETFLNHPRTGRTGYLLPELEKKTEAERRLERERLQLLEEKRQIEQRTLQSAGRSVGLIHESEQVGVQTAEDLLKQREQLKRTEDKLDEMDDTLRSTQRNITSIKSVFGQLRNYFSKTSETSPASTKTPLTSPSEPSNPIQTTPNSVPPKSYGDHPGLRVRGIDDNTTTQKSVDGQLDDHLENMSLGLGRLKGLATGLGAEIEEQNVLLDRINTKADKVDWKVQSQNKSMQRILKK